MVISGKKGQASLEMIVGLIILLVIAAVVIAMALNVLKTPELGPSEADKFVQDCNSLCTANNVHEYCTKKFTGISWNKDTRATGELVDVNIWKACEGGIYCFLATDCDKFGGSADLDYCRSFLCQTYTDQYGNTNDASARLQEIFSVSGKEGLDKCCMKKEDGSELCYKDLPARDKWLQSKFGSVLFCSGGAVGNLRNCGDGTCKDTEGENPQNCPQDCQQQAQIALTNCVYSTASDSITCDTDCLGTVFDGSATRLVVISNDQLSIAADGAEATGTITISGGKVTAKPVNTVYSVSLSGLDQNTTQWIVSFSCQNPKGEGHFIGGVAKQ